MVRNTAGRPERIDGVTRDITEQIGHRRRIERLSRIRELLGALNAAIVRIRERAALFEEFCRIAVARGGFVLARIIEVDREGRVSLAATTESDAAQFRALLDAYNREPEKSDALFARALRSGEAVASHAVANDPRTPHRAGLTREADYSLALLPMVVDGRIAAVVALRPPDPESFPHEDPRPLS